MALNFNCAFIALSMARRTLTFLRHTRIGPYLPIDDHIEVHKIVGVMIGVYSVIHTVCHLANIGKHLHHLSSSNTYCNPRAWVKGTPDF